VPTFSTFIFDPPHVCGSTGQTTAISASTQGSGQVPVKMFERFPKIYNVYFLAIVATMGGMLFGFDISSMSAIIPSDQYL